MPYASPTYHRALSHQRHVAPSRSAGSEIDRVVMRVSRDMQAIHDDVAFERRMCAVGGRANTSESIHSEVEHEMLIEAEREHQAGPHIRRLRQDRRRP